MLLIMMMSWEPLHHHRMEQQQHWVLRNSYSGLSIYNSPLISAERFWEGPQKIDGRRYTYRGSHWVLSPPPDLHNAKHSLQIMQLFCDWGRRKKADFSVPVIHDVYSMSMLKFFLTIESKQREIKERLVIQCICILSQRKMRQCVYVVSQCDYRVYVSKQRETMHWLS